MMLAIIFCLAICEGARVPIQFMTKVPINSEQLTFETSNPIQLPSIHQPRYFLYNILQADPTRPIPFIHFPYGKPGSSYVTSSFNYYGAPLYDYEIHYSPLFPSVPPVIPSYVPQEQPITPTPVSPTTTTTTHRPISVDNNNDDDNIERLDEKMDPTLEMNSTNNEESMPDDDSVVIEAID